MLEPPFKTDAHVFRAAENQKIEEQLSPKDFQKFKEQMLSKDFVGVPKIKEKSSSGEDWKDLRSLCNLINLFEFLRRILPLKITILINFCSCDTPIGSEMMSVQPEKRPIKDDLTQKIMDVHYH